MRIGIIGASVIFVFYLIPFQDLVISYLFLKGFPLALLKILLVLKEIIVVILGALFLFKNRISKVRLFLMLFLGYSLISIFFSQLPIFSTLLGLRTYLLLLFSFVLGEQLSSTNNFVNRFFRHISIVFLLLFVFSFLEYFVLPMTIWKDFFPIMEMKRQVANLSTSNEYYNFGYPVNAFGELTRRMLGPFDEPLYMAYFTILLVNFFLVRVIFNAGKAKSRTILGSIMILLTQTRAIILGYILSIALFLTKGARIKVKYLVVSGAFILLLIPFAIFYSEWIITFINSIFDSSGRNRGHIEAYYTGLKFLFSHPFGSGVGSASTLVGFSDSNNATENAFINIGLEVGFVGMLAFLFFFIFLIFVFRKFIVREGKHSTKPDYQIVSAGYLLAIQFTFSGLVAPHILTARILIPFMIIIGWAYSITNRKLEHENSDNNTNNNS